MKGKGCFHLNKEKNFENSFRGIKRKLDSGLDLESLFQENGFFVVSKEKKGSKKFTSYSLGIYKDTLTIVTKTANSKKIYTYSLKNATLTFNGNLCDKLFAQNFIEQFKNIKKELRLGKAQSYGVCTADKS